MTKFATRSRTMQLALAATVLMPISSFAETPMTARQMLAHAQTQALNVPGDIKRTGPELDVSAKIMSAPVAPSSSTAAAAPSPPVIEPPAPLSAQTAAPPALAMPVPPAEPAAPQARANADSAAPPTEANKAPTAAVAMLPAAATVPESRPSAPVLPPVTAATPSPTTTAMPASAPVQPSVPAVASIPTARLLPDADAPASKKAAPERSQPKMAGTAAPTRQGRKPSGRSATDVSDSSIEMRISRIMRRPEVQSLMSQYGLD